MLILLTLSLFLFACDESPPEPPKIGYQYLIEVSDDGFVAECVRLEIVSVYPYKIKFDAVVALPECDRVGGFQPTDFKALLVYIDDLVNWGRAKLVSIR